MPITAKKAVDLLASDPGLTLSFTVNGEAKWWRRAPLSLLPIQERRSKCIDATNGISSDDLLINVLKSNPGVELQLMGYHGYFPYLVLHVHARNGLNVPEGMFNSEGYLCCTQKLYNSTVRLAEIRKYPLVLPPVPQGTGGISLLIVLPL